MPLDELTDDELDRQLRELLPPSPRSRSWESAQRERLIHFITTGETVTPDVRPTAPESETEVELLDFVPPSNGRSLPRRWWAAMSAAAAVALVVGLVAVQRPPQPPAPAQQPTSPTTGAAEAAPSDVVPSLPAQPLQPDWFGVVTDAWPTAASASAMWGGQIGWDNPAGAEALVARPDGDRLRDSVALSVRADDLSELFPGTPQRTTVAGLDVDVYVEAGTPAITTVVLPGAPSVVASGLDPIAFLEAAGGFPVRGQRIDDDGEVTFAVDALPDGYEVIVPPTRMPLGSVEASTRASDGDGGDGISVWVGVRSALIAWAQAGDLEAIDINGVRGWLTPREPGASVVWQVSDTTWATVAGASTVDDAVTFARAIDFVDEATWTAQYQVAAVDYGPRNPTITVDTTPS